MGFKITVPDLLTGGSEVRLISLSDLKSSILDLDRIIVVSGSGFYPNET